MATRADLKDWVVEALESFGGVGVIVEVAKHIWDKHNKDLQSSGDLYYTWQYDMRWAVTKLRNEKIILPAKVSKRGQWRLK